MVSTRVVDVVGGPQWDVRVDKLRISLNKSNPLVVLGHRDGSRAKLVDGIISRVRFPLKNSNVSVVRFLKLTHNDSL